MTKPEPQLTQEELRAVRLMLRVGLWHFLELDKSYRAPPNGVPMVKMRKKPVGK